MKMKSLLFGLLLLCGVGHASIQDVNIANFSLSQIPVSQFGIWTVGVSNMPTQLGATQAGLWNVGQAGTWYVGQFGSWSINVSGGTVAISNPSIPVTFASSVSITAASPIPVSITGGTISVSASATVNVGTILSLSATSTISTASGQTTQGEVVYGLNMFWDSASTQYRRVLGASTTSNMGASLFSTNIPFSVYQPIAPVTSANNATALQGDSAGDLYVSTRPGFPVTSFDQTVLGQLTTTVNTASQPVRITYTPDINNILGTISLPAGASTESTQLNVFARLGNIAGDTSVIHSNTNLMHGDSVNILNQLTTGVVIDNITFPVFYASNTFTATSGAANGVTIVAAQNGQTICVVGWSISTDTPSQIILHHQGGAAVRSNTSGNIIAGGDFGFHDHINGQLSPGWWIGLNQNQPVCVDVSTAVTYFEVHVAYILR